MPNNRPTLAVVPVVDYEPPPRAVPHGRPSCPPRRRVRSPHHPPAAVLSPALRAAGVFAATALRRVLEVVDRRRPAAQLRPLLTASLVDAVLSMRPAVVGAGGAATLRRLRLQPVGPDDPPGAVEVFGSYTRGPRTHAVACRVEPAPDDDTRWRVVALHIG
ncbi:Rv3235 family protein [Mycobacterium talmoniae]|uniref:Alanine, arginine and proline rich protein n=1 Tax=Mycobacterium talmoniae TaxID=1858794 RepID=A0A1S1NDC9_9MYCO|nr:Rv3235 family protein [Mycobacterium talmoniae]OHV03630.1 hypothetical protein BKN37_14025 [Mycobacterium talmoniae]